MSQIKAVLFDLDGTLVDTAPDFYSTLAVLLARHNEAPIADTVIREHVSNGSRALTKLAFPQISDQTLFEKRRLELLSIYEECVGKSATLFPEMGEILSTLKELNIPWGIVTNKPRLYTELLIERTSFLSQCAVLICADDVPTPKPDPQGILEACKILQTPPQCTLYIGDHKRDVDAAKNANCPSAVVPFGYFDSSQDISAWNADYTINSALTLRQIILASR